MSGTPSEPVMPGPGLAVEQLTKRFGSRRFGTVTAVQDLTFEVQPGRVTGFLGPNGAGKTTTLRMLLGLVRPTCGRATIGGRLYRELEHPMREVGASLEATGFHSGRTARSHLRVLAAAAGVPDSRVPQVIEQIGLSHAADRRVGGFSLGMRQRLALAAALLGDPPVLLLDEPANGLDPEGIAWLRGFLRHLAGQGRTVLVSSHVLSEVAQTVDDVVIIAHGRLIRQATLEELEGTATVLVRTPTPEPLATALAAAQLQVTPGDATGALRVSTTDPALVGAAAFAAGIELHELRRQDSDLESIFLQLTADEQAGPLHGRPTNRTDPTDRPGPDAVAHPIEATR